MTAQPTPRNADCIVVGTHDHHGVRRLICVTITGRHVSIDLARENDRGVPIGHFRLFTETHAPLAEALRHCRDGSSYAQDVTGRYSIVRISVDLGVLGIRLLGLDGVPRGGATVMKGAELVTLGEALRIAAWETS